MVCNCFLDRWSQVKRSLVPSVLVFHFNGDLLFQPDEYQSEWDKLRLAEMGIQQPVKRDIADFDPGLKQHVLAGQEYIRYYISTILQFQFLAALCPTNQIDCDIQQNENAFRILYPMMNKGSTQVNKKYNLEIIT